MRLFPLVSPLFLLAAVRAFPASYQNDALTRTYELGGSITTVTTTLSVRATTDEPGNYKLGLARKGEEGPVAWTVTLRGKELGQVDAEVDSETGALVATVPSTLTKKDETLAIVVTEYFAYQSKPLPAAIDQDEKQFLQYSTNDTWPVTAYPTKKMSIKYRAPRKILSHSKTPTTFLPSESTSLGFKLTGSSLNLGPYREVPASITASSKVKKHALSVHYDTSEPVLAIEELRRFVEIGAWAGNLNFEDKILLRNAGPKLKGQFRKIDLMAAQYRPEFPAQVMRELTYPLTAGAVRPYYYDNTGNISTSHFRPSPPKGGKAILELSPRFPLLGGWKHEITVGWDVQLSEWLKSLGGDKKILAVPFLTGLRGVVVDDAKLIVTLPEGAKDVQVVAPFPVDAIEHSTHKTYLDSTGRPRVTISKKFAAESHEQDIYITYTYPFYANLQKPMTVSIACLFAFSLYWIVKRMDMSIASKKAIAVKVKHE